MTNLRKILFNTSIAVIAGAVVLATVSCKKDKDSGTKDTFDTSKNITIYTRDTTSGTRDGFFSTIGFEDAATDNTPLKTGYVQINSNGDMISSVKQDAYSIGYISLASLETSGLKGLTYEGVDPTESNVVNGTYKLTRNFNYITRQTYDSDKKSQIVEAFVAYLSTKDAKTTIKNNDGIVTIANSDPTWDQIKANYPICNDDNSSITIRFGGSTSVEKIAKALSAEFKVKCGNFVAEHNHTGSGAAYKGTQGSEKDGTNAMEIGFLSRELKSSEQALTNTSGKICTDAIVAAVNASNTKYNKTTAQELKGIYDGTYKTWSAIIK